MRNFPNILSTLINSANRYTFSNLALFLQRNSALILLLDILLQHLLQSLIIQGCRFDTRQHQYNNLH